MARFSHIRGFGRCAPGLACWGWVSFWPQALSRPAACGSIPAPPLELEGGGTGEHHSPYRGCILASSRSKRAVLCSDVAPAACRLAGAERAAAAAEETDIDAVELPLPGADILDFSRGVTDLDAVGKEASAYAGAKVRGSLPSAPGSQRGRDVRPSSPGIRRDCAAFPGSRSKPSAAAGLPFGLGPGALPESTMLGLSYVQPHGKCLGKSR